MSLSRNRFNRFSENVEWWGIASLRSSRQNHLYARWSFTSSHSFLSERAEAVANDKHPDQQLGIDRRSADGAVEWTQLFVQVAEHRSHENIDPAQQVPLRDHVIEPKFVEKVRLLSILSSHHRRIILPSFNQQESSFSPSRKPFFDSIGQKAKFNLTHYQKSAQLGR